MVEEKLLLTVVVQIQDIQMMACFLDFLSKEDMNIKVALEHRKLKIQISRTCLETVT